MGRRPWTHVCVRRERLPDGTARLDCGCGITFTGPTMRTAKDRFRFHLFELNEADRASRRGPVKP